MQVGWRILLEIGQFGSFLKAELAHGTGSFHKAGIIVVHPVDVCPYLYFVGMQAGTDDAGRVVGTAALEVGHMPFGIEADEALRDVYVVVACLLHGLFQVLFDSGEMGLAV